MKKRCSLINIHGFNRFFDVYETSSGYVYVPVSKHFQYPPVRFKNGRELGRLVEGNFEVRVGPNQLSIMYGWFESY